MLTLRMALRAFLDHLGPSALVPEVRRETIVREIMPQIRSLAKSGTDYIDALRDVGLGYRTQDMYADLREYAPSLGWGSDLPGGETALHVYGMQPYKYDVSMWWPDEEGEYYSAAEHRSYHREGFSIWSDEPISYDVAVERAQGIVRKTKEANPEYRDGYFAAHGMPTEWEVTKVHAFEKSTRTMQSFLW